MVSNMEGSTLSNRDELTQPNRAHLRSARSVVTRREVTWTQPCLTL